MKVLDLLFAKGLDESLTYNEALNRYNNGLRKSYELYLYSLQQLVATARQARRDARQRKAKLRPTEADATFDARLYDNELVRSITTNEELQKLVKRHQIDVLIDEDIARKVYQEYVESKEHQAYQDTEQPTQEDHIKALLRLYRASLDNEVYQDYLDDRYYNWEQDKSLIIGAIKKTIKSLPLTAREVLEYEPGEEATRDLGEELLGYAFKQDEDLIELIKPNLKNWDINRIATIDLCLIKMALCELMYFPSIPTKVTINEYVDISKSYSTPKSKEFINGILDSLNKQLQEEGRVVKSGRGLVE